MGLGFIGEGGNNYVNLVEKKTDGLMARKSYAYVGIKELKQLSVVTTNVINGKNGEGKFGRDFAKSVVGYR